MWTLARTRRAAGLVAVYTLGVFLLLEAATRALGVSSPAIAQGPRTRGLWTHDATKGWFHRPGARGEDARGGPDRGRITLNGLGLRRTAELADPRPPGARRLIVLGDSFAFGVGVDDEHTFSAQLEARLSRRAGVPFEVVNMGVSGYSTDQELLLWRELGRRLRPDLVLLAVCDNDLPGNLEDFAYGQYYKPYFALDAGRLELRNVPVPQVEGALPLARRWLVQRSNAWNLLRARLRWGLFEVALARDSSDPQEQTRLALALITALGVEARAEGAPLLVFNAAHQGEDALAFATLGRRLRREGIHVLRMDPPLEGRRRAARAAGERWWLADGHWNVAAHSAVAEVLADHLLGPESPLPPRSPDPAPAGLRQSGLAIRD